MTHATHAPNRLLGKALVAVLALANVSVTANAVTAAEIDHRQGEMVGDVSPTTAILQSRLTAPELDATGDLPGREGLGRFEYATNEQFDNSQFTAWLTASAEQDFIIKAQLTELKPGTRYYYRLQYAEDRQTPKTGPTRSFQTLYGAERSAPVRFVVVTGMNYARYHGDQRPAGPETKADADRLVGYPALVSILKEKPHFFVGTGDNVYYDTPVKGRATTADEMRRKWHEQFVQSRYVDLFAQVPTYWEKDDHDYRYDDCDNTGDKAPSPELGRAMFLEQLPLPQSIDEQAKPYRTYRVSREVQIWLLENRDFRSPNRMPDGPEKTIWGDEQEAWLKRTLLASDAAFKLVISPTPMIGPDDLRKKDNHTNLGGFRHEGDAFFDWARDQGLYGKGFYLLCGDRHWQYHSIHPSGAEEFSSGALVDANSRLGVKPGQPRSTDPEGLIKQPFTSPKPTGGYLLVEVVPADGETKPASVNFIFCDENGERLHQVTKTSS